MSKVYVIWNPLYERVMKCKKVIDGDTMKCLETFEESQTEQMLEKYRSLGKWDDVQIDNDGDIILWEEE